MEYSRLVASEIISANKQVVSGFKYYVRVNMVESVCKNTEENKNKALEDCPTSGNGVNKICKYIIWSRPWMKKLGRELTITGVMCE